MFLLNVKELQPTNGRKSFYGKALVERKPDGSEVLYSYRTPIIERKPDGKLIPLAVENVLSQTTCTHIRAFCGLNKAQYLKLLYQQDDTEQEPAFVETGKQYTDLSQKLMRESLNYLQRLCKENDGTINLEVLDICVAVTYDGGNHPEYASNAFSDVINVHLDSKGNVMLCIDNCDDYDPDRIADAGELYGLALEIYTALKEDGRTYKQIEEGVLDF